MFPRNKQTKKKPSKSLKDQIKMQYPCGDFLIHNSTNFSASKITTIITSLGPTNMTTKDAADRVCTVRLREPAYVLMHDPWRVEQIDDAVLTSRQRYHPPNSARSILIHQEPLEMALGSF